MSWGAATSLTVPPASPGNRIIQYCADTDQLTRVGAKALYRNTLSGYDMADGSAGARRGGGAAVASDIGLTGMVGIARDVPSGPSGRRGTLTKWSDGRCYPCQRP